MYVQHMLPPAVIMVIMMMFCTNFLRGVGQACPEDVSQFIVKRL